MEHVENQIASVLERMLKTAPVSDICPLADKVARPKWICGGFQRGEESFCKSVAGYSKCPHYVKWFYWNLHRVIAKELAKIRDDEQKKKNQKENLR